MNTRINEEDNAGFNLLKENQTRPLGMPSWLPGLMTFLHCIQMFVGAFSPC